MTDLTVRGENAPAETPLREQLRRVARFQRWVLLALLASILMFGFAVIIGTGVVQVPPTGRALFSAAYWGLSLFMLVAVFLLARQFLHPAVAVLCSLAMFIPFVSLIVLLIINQKATNYLREYGVRVGFLGVDPSSI